MSGRFESYIRSYRRKANLSQEDVAFLLGRVSGTNVSRHERGRRAPTVHTALAYEIILGKPVGALYRRLLQSLHYEISQRAKQLLKKEAPNSVLDNAANAKRKSELTRIANQDTADHHAA